MSWTPAPADYDPRTPVTVMLTPAQEMRLELYLAQVRTQHPTADDLQVADLIFSRGLDAVMEENTMQHDAPPPIGDTLTPDEKACLKAYDNRYHKIKAAVGYDEWRAIWFKALEHGRSTAPLDYTAVLSEGESAGSGYGLMASDTPDFDQPGESPGSIAHACAVLREAVDGAGCCIHIDDSASVEVLFGEDDSIHCLPADLPDVLEALSVIESHRPIPVRVTDGEA